MNTFYQKGSKYEPEISLNPQNGVMKISGISMPENTVRVYFSVLDWLNEYKKNPAPKTRLEFDLEYINTASSKMIHEILRIVDGITIKGCDAEIIWNYHDEDSDILEIGEEYRDFVKTNFILEMK
ncbi:MAG: DUF1987 domain-containing protein [Bacteroidales bacterium]|nr:DUF1987 domain-containing protein [Bacteroidales bacterium]